MSFKLLAIRPLKDTSKKLLKGLEENRIYKFYNEYNYEIDEKNCIKKIRYKEAVPSNLYGKNISISAIVGQNGSGKSTLMELIYYSTLICNSRLLNDQEKQQMHHNLNLELFIQTEDDSIKIIKIENNKCKYTYQYGKNKKLTKDEECTYELDATKRDFESGDFNFYSNVLNYSIYGLNSNTMPWIDLIFDKNDAYQMPIVINPFKVYGNYDINKEYMLMQSRAVFYTYVLGIEKIIQGITVEKIEFEMDINKILFLDSYTKEGETYTRFNQFLTLNIEDSNAFDSYNSIVFKELDKEIINSNTLNSFFDDTNSSFDVSNFNNDTLPTIDNQNNKDFFKSFTYLYIFKKLFKISKTYKKYQKYHYLFFENLPVKVSFGNAEEEIKIAISGIDSNVQEGQRDQIIKEIHFDCLMKNVSISNNHLNKNQLYKLKENIAYFYETNRKKKTPLIKRLYDIPNDSNLMQGAKDFIEKLFNGKEYRNFLYPNHSSDFEQYINDLEKDNSHITFKLKQAINYFKNDIFKYLTVNEKGITEHKIHLNIDKKYFTKKTKIEDIPLAVFNHILQVKKINEDKSTTVLPYITLSSGEQHFINSILTIAYHNYNLLSVKEDSDLVKYNNINLIFDELELYLHPEYQRVFISNIISLLGEIKNVTNQDDIKYNIMMVTHSPFILSDIPTQNVLRLKEGKKIKYNKDKTNSFGANIHDLLADDFFLKNGVIGEFAKEKIQDIIEYINNDKKRNEIKWITTPNIAKRLIEQIGERYLSDKLNEMFLEEFPEFKNAEIIKLEEKIKQLKNDSNTRK